MAGNREAVIARAKADRRLFQRVDVDLDGRIFLPHDQREAPCKVFNLSPGGAMIACDFDLTPGSTVILYADEFGRFEGEVVRLKDGNFGIQFQCSALKRERIAEQLTVFLNKDLVDESTLRRHDRKSARGVARFTRANGDIVSCEVLDLSMSGVSLQTDIRPPMGEVLLIGNMAGRVARHHDRGIGVEFISKMPSENEETDSKEKAKAVGVR